MAAAPGVVTYEAAERLEQALGSPFDPVGPLSFAAAVRADDDEQPPEAAFDALRALGGWEWLVPVQLGGRLRSFEELLTVVRVLARRDLTLPVGLGSTLLAAMPVWLWGSDAQRRAVAEHVLAGRFGALCVSEDDAGSDLLATTTRATQTPDGYRLDGEKWLVGNAGRAAFMVVLAAGEQGLELVLVDAEHADAKALRRLPKIRTMGLRGHDLGGMTFDGLLTGRDAAIGTPGRGLEMIAGALQFTRTMIGGLALGAGDTALRVAVRWAAQRRLYGAPMIALAPIGELLAGAFADLLVADCTATCAARGLNAAPRRMALWSASTKYTVPLLCEQALRDCAEVLSARHYLRERVAGGIFQKMLRDVAIASIFEGTQLVQLETVRAQLLHARRRRGRQDDAGIDRHVLFDFGGPLEDWDPAQAPALAYGAHDEICDQLDDAFDELLGAGPEHRKELETLSRALLGARERLRDDVARMAEHAPGRAAEGYALARRYCLLNAAACCVHASARDDRGADGAWLVLALARLLERLGEPCAVDVAAAQERSLAWLVELEQANRLFSIVPMSLPQEGCS